MNKTYILTKPLDIAVYSGPFTGGVEPQFSHIRRRKIQVEEPKEANELNAVYKQTGKCPACGIGKILLGPEGGAAINLCCDTCIQEFYGSYDGRDSIMIAFQNCRDRRCQHHDREQARPRKSDVHSRGLS